MTNDLSLKKIDESIDYFIKKRNLHINLEPLNNYVIGKLNNSVVSSEEIVYLENIILVKNIFNSLFIEIISFWLWQFGEIILLLSN